MSNMKTYYSNINNFKDSTQEMAGAGFEVRYASFLERISDERKEHLMRFKNEDDRLRSMAGTLILTYIINNIHKDDIKESSILESNDAIFLLEGVKENDFSDLTNPIFPLNITSEESGKPYLIDAPDIRFSISHSGLYAAVVVTDSSECDRIGIDIQAKDRKDILKIAKRFYTEFENDLIARAESDLEKEDIFYQIWSVKEAFIKCNGKGLSYGISNFNADIERELITDLEGNVLATLKKQPCPDGYVCYVCTQ
ncbi:4'-phosphopantetheinyl transferase superfamily protein [Butyrivibrio fibrisolvens DSM 3071]|uniref:4'-phosphopantetheinyl transferase superfamily protein n=1 Tax=Butyrivibrio fibrisolvens DSM 3071 TaxID=1121131 RepID=A0A1M5YJ30_BUTFI|nr:4'-phosphopantetheinyl transferase superfamily protein [Butyrivibrio fibrisolvens]SHI11944.1 4'-phosphopantetheinyl transferase superfamily protein [Butyrivibrio fibrisolvens DSM 3071]